MTWIDTVLQSTEHVETPRSFLKWSLFSALAAVASPNVSLDRQGAYQLHPNIYVILLAESGLGKGFGVWVAKSLVRMVDSTRVFSGRNSIQKIITDLSIAYSRKEKEMIKDARAFLATGEFVNLLIKDEQGISTLTEWYDTHYVTEWENSLKSTGVEKLKGVNITLLGATTDDYLRESVPIAAVKGGFFGRIMFIHAKEKGKVNALIDEAKEDEDVSNNFQEWSKYLKEVAKIKHGSKFTVTNQARECFRPWYYDLQNRIREGKLTDKTGYIHRLQDHALKLAMLLSLSDNTELIIKWPHIHEGIELAESLISTVKKTTLGIGLSSAAPKNEVFLRALFKAPDNSMTRRRILQNYHNEFDSNELDKITLTMEDAGYINCSRNGSEPLYKLTSQGKFEFLREHEKRGKKDDKSDH